MTSHLLASNISADVMAQKVLPFLDRDSIQQLLLVKQLTKQFHLLDYYCPEHGTKLQTDIDIDLSEEGSDDDSEDDDDDDDDDDDNDQDRSAVVEIQDHEEENLGGNDEAKSEVEIEEGPTKMDGASRDEDIESEALDDSSNSSEGQLIDFGDDTTKQPNQEKGGRPVDGTEPQPIKSAGVLVKKKVHHKPLQCEDCVQLELGRL